MKFMLKNFSKVFNQNKITEGIISSPEYKFDAYDWSIVANVVDKKPENKFILCTYLQCKSDENNFPVKVLMNLSISNNEKDSRKDYRARKLILLSTNV